jgi:hypothetical protein
MASILVLGSFLAGSLLSLLLPVGLLITLLTWHFRAVMRMPEDPSRGAVHAAGAAEAEGRTDAGEDPPPASPSPQV